MKLFVTVKTKARKEGVQKVDEARYVVSVRALPHDGAANEAVIHVLAKHFHVAPSTVALIKGSRSKQKIFEIAA